MTIDYIPGTTSNLVGDPAEGGAFSSGNKGEIAGANTAAANAATSATAAAASAAEAAQSETSLSASETNAGLSAASAQVAAAQASASKNTASGILGSVSTIYDDFDDRYLGSKTSEPTLDNDGGALLVGAIYFNSTTNQMKVYNGSAWQITAVDSNAVAFLAGATFTGDVNIERGDSSDVVFNVHNTSPSDDADAIVRIDSSADGESIVEFYHDGTIGADIQLLPGSNPNLNITTHDTGSVIDIQPNQQTVARFEASGLTVYNDVTAPEFIGVLQGETVFKAKAGEALSKGDAVYVSGISGNTPVVSKADANGANTYPAFGLAAADTANNGTLDVITAGQLKNFDTSGFTLGDTLYLSTTPGVLTATPPTGEGSVIQNMGKVEREHASAGSILVVGAGRSAATPNLDYGNIFIGNLQNKAVTGSFNTLADARADVRIANNIIDEDSFSTNSATRAPSQQSVKQYVANQTANIQGDITNVITGNGLTGGGTSGAVTLAVDTTVVATAGNTLSLNNKTLNTPDINSPDIDGGTVDGATIGGSTAAAGTFTNIGATNLKAQDGTAAGSIADSTGIVTIDNGLELPDDKIIKLGDTGAMEIFHNGQNSVIREQGPGALSLRGNEVTIKNYAGTKTLAYFTQDDAAEFFFNNVKTLETVDGGAAVTGTLSAGITTISGAGAASTDPTLIVDRTGTADGAILSLKAGGTANANFFSTGGNRVILCDNTNNGIKFTPSSIHPRTSTNGALNNTIDLGLSSSKFRNVYANGIIFDAVTGDASSNTLDDYEEGTWTPAYTAVTTSPTVTYAPQNNGHYTKVGRLVTLTGRIRTASVDNSPGGTDAAGGLRISGLPFVVSSDVAELQNGTLHCGQIKTFTSGRFPAGGYAVLGSSEIALTRRGSSSGNMVNLDVYNAGGSNFTLDTGNNANEIVFSVVYYTDE